MRTTLSVTPRRSAAGAAIIIDVGIEYGVPIEAMLRDTGLTEHQLREPTAEIDAWQEIAVASNLLSTCYAPGLGLITGSRYRITTYGSWGLAMANSATMRDAVQLGLRYFALTHSFCRVSFDEDDTTARFHLDATGVPEQVRTFFTERTVAASLLTARDILPEFRYKSGQFAYPRPAGSGKYDEILGVPATFDAPQTAITVERELLDPSLPRANENTVRWYEQQARGLLDRRKPQPSLATQVHAYMLDSPDNLPTVSATAHHFELSVRTLNRKLATEGTNFRTLLDDTRQRLAEDLLRAGLSVGETSCRLGYAEPASFQHAFRRWRGMSAGQFARNHRSTAAP
ncbi:AraC family transcriptional regulator [Nocardia suismassiliense]|uniref:AraC family transcriptional regulator n=1 Tax=Nocardia suismassiliense TaxID=2077092 RepID=UPI00131F3541|nr:AraC family transcriptional regulator [Nocardia suismassiliense]